MQLTLQGALLLAAAALSGCAAPAPAAPVPTAPSPSAQLAALPEPDRLWIRDAWTGLGTGYELTAQLLRLRAIYEVQCTLRVFPMSPDGRMPPARVEAREMEIAAAPVNAFLDAARRAAPEYEEPGTFHISPIDDTGEAEIFLFYTKRSGPVYLNADPVHRFTIDLDRRYSLRDHGEAYQAFRAMIATMGVEPWVEAVSRAALADDFSTVRSGGRGGP